MVSTTKSFECTPIDLSKKLFLWLASGAISAFVVFIFLFVWDGSEWTFIEGGTFPNVIMLFFFGLAFATLYFGREFKRINGKTMHLNDKEFIFENTLGKQTYTINQLINIRVDRMFYLFIGYERLTLTFQVSGMKRKQHEVIVFKKGIYNDPKETIINHIKTLEQVEESL